LTIFASAFFLAKTLASYVEYGKEREEEEEEKESRHTKGREQCE
jgi:hypothetical protein